jgi:hypothetical protein
MKPYALKRYTQTYDELGTPIYSYVAVATIPVSINYTVTNNIDNGILYTIRTPQGITQYKAFDLKEKYRLEGNGQVLDVESIVQESRYAQLILKEVLI